MPINLRVDLIRHQILSAWVQRHDDAGERLFSSRWPNGVTASTRAAFSGRPAAHWLRIWLRVRSNAPVLSCGCERPIATRYKSNMDDDCVRRGTREYCCGDGSGRTASSVSAGGLECMTDRQTDRGVSLSSRVTRPGHTVVFLTGVLGHDASSPVSAAGRSLSSLEYWPAECLWLWLSQEFSLGGGGVTQGVWRRHWLLTFSTNQWQSPREWGFEPLFVSSPGSLTILYMWCHRNWRNCIQVAKIALKRTDFNATATVADPCSNPLTLELLSLTLDVT